MPSAVMSHPAGKACPVKLRMMSPATARTLTQNVLETHIDFTILPSLFHLVPRLTSFIKAPVLFLVPFAIRLLLLLDLLLEQLVRPFVYFVCPLLRDHVLLDVINPLGHIGEGDDGTRK